VKERVIQADSSRSRRYRPPAVILPNEEQPAERVLYAGKQPRAVALLLAKDADGSGKVPEIHDIAGFSAAHIPPSEEADRPVRAGEKRPDSLFQASHRSRIGA
jgi:hypothetical protein